MKKKTATYYRKKCVDLAKRIVRHKSGYRCVYTSPDGQKCSQGEANGKQTHGSHIYCENAHKSISSDLDNILCLCSGHHVGMGNVTPNWHKDPKEMMEWFEKTYSERGKKLKDKKNKNIHMGLFEWKKRYEFLKEEWNKLIN
jgi:hypothetical protein